VPDGTLSGWILLVAAASGRPVKELLSTWRYKISTIYDADFCRDVPPLAAMASMTFAAGDVGFGAWLEPNAPFQIDLRLFDYPPQWRSSSPLLSGVLG